MTTKDQVLEVIKTEPGCDAKTIANSTSKHVETVRKACKALIEEGKVTRNQVKIGNIRKFLFNVKVEEKTTSRKDLIRKAKASSAESAEKRVVEKNRSKVSFNGEEFGKAKLVLAVVKDHVKNNNKTFAELAKELNFSSDDRRVYSKYDVIAKMDDKRVVESKNGKYKRYNFKNVLTSTDGVEFVICREWGIDNVDRDFILPIANGNLNLNVDTFIK